MKSNSAWRTSRTSRPSFAMAHLQRVSSHRCAVTQLRLRPSDWQQMCRIESETNWAKRCVCYLRYDGECGNLLKKLRQSSQNRRHHVAKASGVINYLVPTALMMCPDFLSGVP